MKRRVLGVLAAMTIAPTALSATLQVGPGQTYATPCAAIGAAQAGDLIQVDAAGNGTYDSDSCSWSTDNLTIQGINGRARINAGGNPVDAGQNISNDKGIFAISAPNATIESFELAGAAADPGSLNGAGIRHQGTNLTVSNCYIHDNQDGILGNPTTANTGTVLIQFSEFAHNGAGDGYSHNLYLGEYAEVIVQYSYSHESTIGHLLKSRADLNLIQYNLLADLADGTGSYEVDLPQGGASYLIGNAIEQSDAGAYAGNPTIVSYAEENQNDAIQELYLVNNTLVNDSDQGTFVHVSGTPTVTLTNNIFHGQGTVTDAPTPLETSCWTDGQGNPLLNAPSTQDYTLQAGSPCIGAGSSPGVSRGLSLAPVAEYAATASGVTRDDNPLDIGAFQHENAGEPVDGGAVAFEVDGGATGTTATTGGVGVTTASASAATATGTAGTTSGTASGTTTKGASSGTSMAAAGTGSTTGTSAASTSGTSGGAIGSSTAAGATTGTAGADGGTTEGVTGGCGCGSAGPSEVTLLALALVALGLRRGSRSATSSSRG